MAAEVKIPVGKDTRRRVRVLKAREGWTYDEALTALVEEYDGEN